MTALDRMVAAQHPARVIYESSGEPVLLCSRCKDPDGISLAYPCPTMAAAARSEGAR